MFRDDSAFIGIHKDAEEAKLVYVRLCGSRPSECACGVRQWPPYSFGLAMRLEWLDQIGEVAGERSSMATDQGRSESCSCRWARE